MKKVKFIYFSLIVSCCIISCFIISFFYQNLNAPKSISLSSSNIAVIGEGEYIPVRDFKGASIEEDKGIFQVIEMLKLKNLNVDEFYVGLVDYPDPLNMEIEDKNSIYFDIVHRSTIIYRDSIKQVNIQLRKDHEGEEWIPMVIGATGNVSGEDRCMQYFIETNTVYDFLAQ